MCIQYHEVCERKVLLGNRPKIFSISPVVSFMPMVCFGFQRNSNSCEEIHNCLGGGGGRALKKNAKSWCR